MDQMHAMTRKEVEVLSFPFFLDPCVESRICVPSRGEKEGSEREA